MLVVLRFPSSVSVDITEASHLLLELFQSLLRSIPGLRDRSLGSLERDGGLKFDFERRRFGSL